VIENGAVAIRGERILAVGPRAEIDARFRPRSAWTAPTPSSRPA
jgi:predicted amidohydrolase YtcJ